MQRDRCWFSTESMRLHMSLLQYLKQHRLLAVDRTDLGGGSMKELLCAFRSSVVTLLHTLQTGT